MAFDVQGALKAGYTMEEIGQHVKFDVAGAKSAGYSDDEIMTHLAGTKIAPDAPKPKEPPGLTTDLKNVGREFVEGISNPKPSYVRNQVDPVVLGPALNVAGQTGKAFGGALMAGGKAAVNALPDVITAPFKDMGNTVLKSLKGNPIVDAAVTAFNALPEESKTDFGNLANVTNLIGLPPVARGTAAVTKEGVNIARDVGALANAGQKLTRAKNFIIGKPSEEQALKQILQTRGKTPDIIERQTAAGRETLSKINTEGVKNYTQLRKNIDDAITEYAKKVDDELLKDPTKYTIDELATVENTAKGTPAKSNYVKTALDQLEELYVKTGDNLSAAEIGDLKNKAISDGLTKKEVNDLARKYGTEFKAFNPTTGAPPTSVTKEMYENIRGGLKEVARRGLSDTAKELDSTMSKFYTTRQLIDKNVEAANRLYQKVDPRGLGEKAGRALWSAIDLATLGTAKGALLKFIPRGMGYKVKNFIDLDEALSRNLKILNEAEKRTATTPEMRSATGKAIMGQLSGLDDVLNRDIPGAVPIPRRPIARPDTMEVGPVRSGVLRGEAYAPPSSQWKPKPKELPAGQGFELKGGAYGPDVIDVPFTSKIRTINQLTADNITDLRLSLPPGQGFELVDRVSARPPEEALKIIQKQQPQDEFIGSNLRAARERMKARETANERQAENLVTRVQQLGGIQAGKDYNARILRQNPDAKRVLNNARGQAPDTIASQLQAEGWPITSGDELIELLKSGKGRTIYNPQLQDKLITRDIRRAENEWIEKQLEKEQFTAGEAREAIPDHQARVIDEIGQEGIIAEGKLDQALKEVSDFFEEMSGKAKQTVRDIKQSATEKFKDERGSFSVKKNGGDWKWWEGRDFQNEIESLPRKVGQDKPRNPIKEGYVPITRAEYDDLFKNKMDDFVAIFELRGPVESTGDEGIFMRPLSKYQGYGGINYDKTKWQNQKAIDLYEKYKERYLRGNAGNTDAQTGRNTTTLRKDEASEGKAAGVADVSEKYNAKTTPQAAAALIEEAKKYKSADEFVKSREVAGYDADYRTDLLRGNGEDRRLDISPDKKYIFESNNIPFNAKEITIYRSSPGELRPGDYAGLNEDTARLHLRNENDKITSKKVPVSDLIQGADQYEVIYVPRDSVRKKAQLIDIWNKAHQLPNPSRPPEVGGESTSQSLKRKLDALKRGDK